MAGLCGLDPYTAVVDCSTNDLTALAFWHAASSCMVPMTASSRPVPVLLPGAVSVPVCTTVSTAAVSMTLAITGLRMSARTNSTPSNSTDGGATSTPTTRSIPGSRANVRANSEPGNRETPVTSTILLMVASRDGVTSCCGAGRASSSTACGASSWTYACGAS